MKGIKELVIAGLFVLATTPSFAADNGAAKKTSNNAKWTCTTNASGAANDADKKADDKMANEASSADKAFKFAKSHCRDCTKITCETQANPSAEAPKS